MSAKHASRIAITALVVALAATLSSGVTFALTRVSGYHACANSSGTLRLLGSRGTCPAGYSKVTLGATGPRGLQGVKGDVGAAGPSLVYIRQRTTGIPDTSDLSTVTVDTVTVPSGEYLVHADLNVAAGNAASGTEGFCELTNGTTKLSAHDFAVSPTGNNDVDDSLSAALNTRASATISVGCTSGNLQVLYSGTLTVTKVGALNTATL